MDNGCYTSSKPERTSAASRETQVLKLSPNDPAADGNVLVGVRNALLIEAGVVALIALLNWLF